MKEYLFGIMIIVVLAITSLNCTEQQRAKGWGGTAVIELPCNEKLVTVTWKKEQFWYLTRAMKEGEQPQRYLFRESASWGLIEGTVKIKECVK